VVAQRGEHAAVQVAERVEQVVAHRDLGTHPARPGVREADAEIAGEAFALLVRPHETVGDALVVGLERRSRVLAVGHGDRP
jgi:hypothetical protein